MEPRKQDKMALCFFFKLTFLYYEAEGIMFFTSKDPNGRKNIEKKPKYRLIARGKKKMKGETSLTILTESVGSCVPN